MTTQTTGLCEKPAVRPNDPRFSSGPCKKHPNWDLSRFITDHLGRSHRAPAPKARLESLISRSAKLLALPDDWHLAIVPASDTGAFELAMWNMLGARGVDIFAWESFSSDWAIDIQQQLQLSNIRIHFADYGALPDLNEAAQDRDVVFVYNGTTSGVRVPNMDWISDDREGLVFCDATSAAFAMEMDFSKLDVVTWSWQKVLGGEGGFGMLALSPRAIQRLESYTPAWPLPKIFRLVNKGKVDKAVFKGSTLNTPSLLAAEDMHSALDWAESIGGLSSLHTRSRNNYAVVKSWVDQTDWIDWLAKDSATHSSTSMCLKIVHPEFAKLGSDQQNDIIKQMCNWLEEENVAFDIAAYRSAPPGFRLWGGATVEADDLEKLLPWLDWAFQRWLAADCSQESV